jgi:membrane protein required for beta-lactamase induction
MERDHNTPDGKYVKRQMKAIKKAKQNGNDAKAKRLATELLQYFGMDEDSETPILDVVENVGSTYETAVRDLY